MNKQSKKTEHAEAVCWPAGGGSVFWSLSAVADDEGEAKAIVEHLLVELARWKLRNRLPEGWT